MRAWQWGIWRTVVPLQPYGRAIGLPPLAELRLCHLLDIAVFRDNFSLRVGGRVGLRLGGTPAQHVCEARRGQRGWEPQRLRRRLRAPLEALSEPTGGLCPGLL